MSGRSGLADRAIELSDAISRIRKIVYSATDKSNKMLAQGAGAAAIALVLSLEMSRIDAIAAKALGEEAANADRR